MNWQTSSPRQTRSHLFYPSVYNTHLFVLCNNIRIVTPDEVQDSDKPHCQACVRLFAKPRRTVLVFEGEEYPLTTEVTTEQRGR